MSVPDTAREKTREERTPRRLSINISDEVAEVLRQMAERRNTTVTEVIRDAISMEKFLDEQQARGDALILRGEDGREREIVRLR